MKSQPGFSLAFLSGLRVWKTFSLVLFGLSISRVQCRHENSSLEVTVEVLGYASESSVVNGMYQCPAGNYCFKIRKICWVSCTGEFVFSISSISLVSLLSQPNYILLCLGVKFIQIFYLVLYKMLQFL